MYSNRANFHSVNTRYMDVSKVSDINFKLNSSSIYIHIFKTFKLGLVYSCQMLGRLDELNSSYWSKVLMTEWKHLYD